MQSWTHRRSRKQFFRLGQPISPDLGVAGKNVSAFQRVLLAQYPPADVLIQARAVRHGGVSENIGSSYDFFVILGNPRSLVPNDFIFPIIGDIETRIGG